MSAVLNTERLSVGKKTDISDAYSAPANFLEIEGMFFDVFKKVVWIVWKYSLKVFTFFER